MSTSKIVDPPSPVAETRGDSSLVVQSTSEQRERNRAAVAWLDAWRGQPPVEGEMSWEEFDRMLQENTLSPRGPAHD